MKNFLVLSLFSLIAYSADVFSCSIQVKELQTTNSLVAAAANEFNIPLNKVTNITTSNFAFRLYEPVPDSSCEHYLEFKVQVKINYQPTKFQKCELNVEAILTQDLYAESYPFEEYSFNLPTSSCTKIPVVIRPPRFP
jgi:hypothetical protein